MRSILTVVGGFLVRALRDESAIPQARRGPALWAASDTGIDATTIEALAAPPDLHALFESTVRAVVDTHVPDPS
jgi:hypothetical protein